MTVIYTSHSPYPDSPEIRCLNTSPFLLLAPSLGLVSSGRPMPSGPTPLGFSEEKEHANAADSHNKLAMDGGDSQNAPIHPFISIPPAGDTQGALRSTQSVLVPVALAVRSPNPTTGNLVTLADLKCNHSLPFAHHGRFSARPLTSANTHTRAPLFTKKVL
jgi:hypothetical protein